MSDEAQVQITVNHPNGGKTKHKMLKSKAAQWTKDHKAEYKAINNADCPQTFTTDELTPRYGR